MSIEYETIGPSGSPKSYSWSEVWVNAITKPAVETYEDIVADPAASASKAYTWVLITAFISYSISIGLSFLLDAILGVSGLEQFGILGGITSSILLVMCCAPILSLFAVLALALNAGISQFVAGLLGGTGSYNELAYAFGAYQAPLTLITGAISVIPYLNCLGILFAIYGIALNVIAIKAVNKFDWGRAIMSSVIVIGGIIAFFACIVIVILALLGPAIGTVFSNIIMDI
jgi:hypothetical protein